jgi:putative component of membrane protein insertase Oxa1/YidC/SpoIIIJ protein YidD
MINALAVNAISLYQRHISPYKGFQCAYRVYSGKCSCSEYAKRIVAKRGAWALLNAMPRQFSRCKSAYTMLLKESLNKSPEMR